MTHARSGLTARAIALAVASLMILPAAAAAFDFSTAPASGPITATLPLLGSSLKVDVAVDASGALSSVALDPVGDFTATGLHPHAVKFENADGSVKVTIRSWGGSTQIKARAGTLASLVGSGTWKADVFGTGDPTTVAYTIGDDGSGNATLSIDSVSAGAGITATAGTPKMKTWTDGSSASGRVDFAWNGFKKHLTIGVLVSTKADKVKASLALTLSARSGQTLSGTLADVSGSHTWHGQLCDGTNIGIAFQVADDGSGNGIVTYDPATFASGAPAHARTFKHGTGFVAVFDGKRAAVLVWLRKLSDGTYKLSVGSFAGKWCKGTTVPNPAVNTPISADATKGSDGKWHWNFWGGSFEGVFHQAHHGWSHDGKGGGKH